MKISAPLLMILLVASTVSAAEPASTNSTKITCDGPLTFDYQRYTAEFERNVLVVDPNMRLQADKLNVIFDNESNIKQAIAMGHVKMTHEDKVGTCDRAIYIAKTGEMMMVGNAQLKRNADSVKGDKITFWLNEDRMMCEPGNLLIIPTKGAGLPAFNPIEKK